MVYMSKKKRKRSPGRKIHLPERNSIVFDSYAIIGYLENEMFSSRVEKILKQDTAFHRFPKIFGFL